MSQVLYKQIDEMLRGAQRILLCTDTGIDGDTMGSTLGMMHILRTLGKEVTVFSPEPLPKTLAFLPGVQDVLRDPAVLEGQSFDLMCIFDCSHGRTLDSLPASIREQVPLIVFDHHATTVPYGRINLIETEAASTGDVVYRFVKWAKYQVNTEAAQCLLTAICTDTDLFFTSNTTAACFDAAQELSALGAKLHLIVRHTMMNRSPQTLQLWGRAFDRLFHFEEFGVLATAITRKDIEELGLDDSSASDLSNYLNGALEDQDAILVLRETEDGVKGSLRSHTRNVAVLAQRYGGGGHEKAAGFFVKGAHLEEKDGHWFIINKHIDT